MPYKVYGIFAAGRPTIFVGNRRSEIADWVTRYQTGVCVEQGRTDLLISAIRDIKGDPAKAAEMGRAARRLADALLHSRTAAEAWAGLIDRVLDESTAHR
jgi:glycosyltransferase involved in cell wall biosynthesis